MSGAAVRSLVALTAGLMFGAGLALSQMVNPVRAIGFLDLAGDWDPCLALVMAGALAVTVPAFPWIVKRRKPVLADRFELPTRRDVDRRLVAGSLLFGVGWGIGGFCPGPALAALATGRMDVVVFVVAMFVGFAVARLAEHRR